MATQNGDLRLRGRPQRKAQREAERAAWRPGLQNALSFPRTSCWLPVAPGQQLVGMITANMGLVS